jgi:MoaA/NifB/PqqE/SkfB family radical SAM enzyme
MSHSHLSAWLDITARDVIGRMRSRAGYASPPSGIDLLLTNACNLQCSYCPVPRERRPAVMMDTAKALSFLSEVSVWHPRIRLFGGEPFLHPEWFRIVSHGTSLGLSMGAVSNGTRLAGRAEDLVRSGLSAIGFSIDPPEVHDRFRGEGTFEACERVIRDVHRTRKRLGKPNPAIVVYSTVHEGSYRHLLAWAERLRDWPIDCLRLQHRIWLSKAQREDSEKLMADAIGDIAFFGSDLDWYCSDEMPSVDCGELGSVIRSLRGGGYPFDLEFVPPLPVEEIVESYRDPGFVRRTARACTTVFSYAFVDPAGRLFPCLTLDMGNVFDRPFERVWNGRRFRAFRALLRRVARMPLCQRCPS